MKKIKRMMAIAIAIILTLGVSNCVLAAVPTTQSFDENNAANDDGKYTISVASGDTHTYQVFQILTGSLVAGESKLGNPQWGSDANATTTYATVKAFIDAISAAGLSNQEINAIAESVLRSDAAGVAVPSSGKLDVVPGYYLIKDTTATLEDGDAKSLNIVAVFNDITITPKKGTTTSEKHVDDQNDSNSSDHSELKDSADYDIGDTIPYTLTATLPEDYANYKKYYISFTDDMSAGLTLNADSVKIFYGSSDTTGTSITFTADNTKQSQYTGGTVYTYTINDLKTGTDAQKALTAGSVIKITYTATLNNRAVIGSAGNPNRYKIDFSSNPNETGDGTPETNDTPWDINIVFTYKTVFNKVDADKKPLTGADFTLFKFIEDENGTDTYNSKKGTWTDVTTLGDGTNKPSKVTTAYTKESKTAENATFTFSGIDAGVYKLKESKTPTGYNTLEDQIFTITAEHTLEAANPTLESLTGTDGAQFTMTASTTDASLTAEIENKQGAVLPSTGGMGTTIFYIIGVVLLAGAAIILVTKRRMNAE